MLPPLWIKMLTSNYNTNRIYIFCLYLCTDKIPVIEAVHLPVQLKHTVLGTSAHEVKITLAGGKTAAHSRPGLSTTIAPLQNGQHK